MERSRRRRWSRWLWPTRGRASPVTKARYSHHRLRHTQARSRQQSRADQGLSALDVRSESPQPRAPAADHREYHTHPRQSWSRARWLQKSDRPSSPHYRRQTSPHHPGLPAQPTVTRPPTERGTTTTASFFADPRVVTAQRGPERRSRRDPCGTLAADRNRGGNDPPCSGGTCADGRGKPPDPQLCHQRETSSLPGTADRCAEQLRPSAEQPQTSEYRRTRPSQLAPPCGSSG